MSGIILLPRVAFDESGNTGQHLLDPDQPIFVYSSVCVGTDVARELIAGAMPPRNGAELHFSRLRRSAAGRRTLLNVLDSGVLGVDTTLSIIIHKSFMVTCKIVDVLIEPQLHDRRYNLYQQGENIALANVLHATLPVFIGYEQFTRIQHLFVEMIREHDHEAVERFYSYLWFLFPSVPNDDAQGFVAMILSSYNVAQELYTNWDLTDLDPAFPGFFELACRWTPRLDTPFVVVHDDSNFIRANKDKILQFMAWDEPFQYIGYDRRKIAFPPHVVDIQFADSMDCPEIQLADVLASAVTYANRRHTREVDLEFVDDLRATAAFQSIIHPIWPEVAVTPEELGTIDDVGDRNLLEHVTRFLASRDRGNP